MYSSILKATAVFFAAVSRAELMERDVYLKHSAPRALDQVNDFRLDNDDSLSKAQHDVLDFAEKIIKEHLVDKIPEFEKLCETVFTKEQCNAIVHPPVPGSEENDKHILGRQAPDCSCSTGFTQCPKESSADQGICVRLDQDGSCNYSSRGCGDFWLHYCNGICR